MDVLSAELPAKYNHAVRRYAHKFGAMTSADAQSVHLELKRPSRSSL